MKTTRFSSFLSLAILAGMLCIPLTGCGVESEPVGVEGTEEEEAIMESEEYIEGEEGI